MQWLSGKAQYGISPTVIKITLLAGLVSAVLSCITGYLLSLSGDYDEDLASLHMWMGFAVAAVSILLYLKVRQGEFDLLYKVSSVALLIIIIITGHLGGSLTHGSDYLSIAWKNKADPAIVKQQIIANIQEASAYADVIQPILQTRCYSCHDAHKQKGGLRMDGPKWLVKGGKDGQILVPGKAAESELVKRLLLPEESEHHMPPKGKPQLNGPQVALLHWWVTQGADFAKKVKEITQPVKIKPMLLALQRNHLEHKAPAVIPVESVEKGDEKAIRALRNTGAVVMQVAQGSNYLTADFINAAGISDRDIQLLLPLKKQLVWLKLGNTKITDNALLPIAQCTNLTQLQLNNTAITDKGVGALKSLNKLQWLNLVGTKVSAMGIKQLEGLQKLQSLYLYQTNVKSSDWLQLKKIFPKTVLDSGGYTLAFIKSDTMVVKPPRFTR
ncbi:MAG: ribonuclease inhibitor [Sediminibacterium sp.]